MCPLLSKYSSSAQRRGHPELTVIHHSPYTSSRTRKQTDLHLNTRPVKTDTQALALDSFSDTCQSQRPWTWSSVAQLTDSKGSPSSLRTCWHVKCRDKVSASPVLGYANFSEVFPNNCI